uniref:Uncharacterized protein n=1 Tax=Anguilla anguilla TaxID=7936 RepID=A0A0E9R033_ANGAN
MEYRAKTLAHYDVVILI